MKVGINGMGRIGRLALRAAFGAAERQADDPYAGNRLQVVHLNELKGGAATTAHLLAFDTVQGKWRTPIAAEGEDREEGQNDDRHREENRAAHLFAGGERDVPRFRRRKPSTLGVLGSLGVADHILCDDDGRIHQNADGDGDAG